MKKIVTLKNLKAYKCRSAWSKGVKAYAYMLLNNIFSNNNYKEIKNYDLLHEALLNGALNWMRFSWGGCALIYDKDIAKTLCSPSKLKKCKNGSLAPSRNRQWLDVQAKALYQAEVLIKSCVEF